jgi:hypothetical protein
VNPLSFLPVAAALLAGSAAFAGFLFGLMSEGTASGI